MKKSFAILLLMLGVACSNKSTEQAPSSEKPAGYPEYAWVIGLAGPATSEDSSSSLSFNVPVPVLSKDELELHLGGDIDFNRQFNGEQGLGPAFNASSCVVCHARDGRGALPVLRAGRESVRFGPNESLLLRVSLETEEGPVQVPGFTEQIHQRGIYSLRQDLPGIGQTDIEMRFHHSTFTYPDGETVELRKPVFQFVGPYDETESSPSRLRDPRVRISPRIGPPVIGLGLLDAIDDKQLMAMADPDDRNGDGIRGKVNLVRGRVGRHGWKANNPDVLTQVAAALNHDMGLTNSLFPLENILGTTLFTEWTARLSLDPAKLHLEVSDVRLERLSFYTSTLAVPKRRNVLEPEVVQGAKQFEVVGCTGCHTPKIKTGTSGKIDHFKNQTIYPFTDGLLHDMGDELADNRADHEASGREWRTRPLWGIGLTQTINPRAGFLHDGRARTLEEAILHHGGEAAPSRQRFSNLPKSARQELLSFLRSL